MAISGNIDVEQFKRDFDEIYSCALAGMTSASIFGFPVERGPKDSVLLLDRSSGLRPGHTILLNGAIYEVVTVSADGVRVKPYVG